MAITVPGSGSSATTSVTIPTHAVGDMIVIAARGTVAPTAPAAGGTVPTWTTPTNQTGVNNSIGWRLATTIATATNHTSGTWTNAAQMHVLVLRPTSGNTLAVGNDPAQGGANNTQTMIYPAFTLTAGKVSNLVIRYGARGVADTEVRTDGAFAASGVFATEQPATTPTSATFTKVVTASEGTFTATPAGTNAAYRCGTVEITESVPVNNWSQPEDEAPTVTDAQTKGVTSPKADAIAGVDAQAKAVTSPQADAATVTDACDPQLTEGAFSPPDIAGLECWLKADAIGLADGANVTTWEDSHTSNKDATGATGQTLETNEINGLPVVRFDGVDDKMTVALTGNDATRTIFVVARTVAAGYTSGDAVCGWSGLAGISMQGASAGVSAFRWLQNQAGANQVLGGVPTTTASIITLRFNSTSSVDSYIGSGTATNFDPNDAYQAVATDFALGSRTAAGTSFGNVEIGEVLIYNSALADADLDDVRDYLGRWFAASVGHSQPVDDSIAGTDAQAKQVARPQADAVAGTDAQTKAVTSSKADAVAGTDAQAKAATHPVADSAAATDATTRAWTAARTQPDAIAGTDTQAKTARHPLADTIAGTDARSSKPGHAIADTIAGTDASTRRPTKAQADAIAGTDARATRVTRPQADAISGTDATARVWAAKLTVADGIAATDNVNTSAAGANQRNVDDSIAATDAVARTTTTRRTVTDSAAGTDAKAASVKHPVTDAITGTDARSRVWAAKFTVADGIAATDALGTSSAGANEKALDDSISATDSISVSLGLRRALGDSLTAADARAAQVDYTRQPADAIAVADVVARAWAIIETQTDGLTVTDAVNARIPPSRWLPGTDEDWPADTDEDWEAQTDDRWLVSAESRW